MENNMNKIKWTTNRPNKPGFYWELCIKSGKKEVHIVKAIKNNGRIYFRNTAFVLSTYYDRILYSVDSIPYPRTPSMEDIKNNNFDQD